MPSLRNGIDIEALNTAFNSVSCTVHQASDTIQDPGLAGVHEKA